ncbi:hypothetical protein [Natronorarus salvus]|uniref:hypothetical protein n=1 Tax=Natronorarus salvus TaxID=3117733 RepID=UPI002F26CE86
MVSTDTQITAVFVVLAVVLWYVTTGLTDSTIAALAVLIGVGLVLPLGIRSWRHRSGAA